jgi:CRP/FNR family transcriptional regulator, cyclic AMP receptor protein
MDRVKLLRSVLFLRPLSDDVLESIASAVHAVTFAPGTRFITEGQMEDDAYLIADGEAEVSVRNGRIRTLTSGEMVGEMAAIASRPRTASVTALTTVTALVLTGEFLRDLMRENPNVAAVIAREMSSRAG